MSHDDGNGTPFTDRFKGSPFFRALAEIVLRHRAILLFLTLVGTGVAVWSIRTKLHIDNSLEAFGSAQSVAMDRLEDFRDDFGRDEAFMISVEARDDGRGVFDLQFMKRLVELHRRVASLNPTLESLGERKIDRDLVRNRPVPLKRLLKHWGMAGAVDEVRKAATPARSTADDPFAGFDFGRQEDGDGSFQEAPGQSGWGKEAGGTVMDDVISLLNVRRTLGKVDDFGQNELTIGELMDPMPATQEELDLIRERVLGNPAKGQKPDKTLIGQVVSADGRVAVVLARTMFMNDDDSNRVNDELQKIVDDMDAEGFRIHLAGMPATGAAIRSLMLSDMQMLFGLAIGTLFVLMLLIFRNPLGVLAPAGVVVMAGIWALGIMAALGMSMTIITNVLPAFLICVGVGDSIHIQSVFRDALRRGVPNREAIIHAVADTGMPVVFTTVTTALGLLSFQFASLDAIAEMGLIGAIGVGLALLHTLVFLPIVLSFNKKSLFGAREGGKHDILDTFLGFCASLSGSPRGKGNGSPQVARRRRRLTLAGGALVVVASLLGAAQVRVWHNPIAWIPPDEPIRIAHEITDEKLGGSANIQLMVETGRENGVMSGALMKGLEKLEEHVRGYVDPGTGERIVGNVTSVADVVREQNRAWHGGSSEHYRVPENDDESKDYLTTFQNQRSDLAGRLMTTDAAKAQMTIRLKWLEATSYAPLTKHLDEGLKEHVPAEAARITATGSVYTLLTTVSSLITNLVVSFGGAFVAVLVFMVILLRQTKLGIISMIPNVLPIILVIGIMGVTGIPVDMANMMIASIALGVAVDDTIHFLHHYRVHYEARGDVEAAIAHSLEHTGRAITLTSVLLVAGFAVYLGATMYSLQRFGMLIGVVIAVALLSNLIFCPALLRTFYKNRTPERAEQ